MINKNKSSSCSSLSLRWALLFIVLVKTHIDNPVPWRPPSGLLKNMKKSTAEYNRQISDKSSLSKYWVIKAVFHAVDFRPGRFFWLSSKTKAVSCHNIQTTLEKTFRSKWDINFFEITLPPHILEFFYHCLGLFLVFICSNEDVYTLYWFISIN